MVDREPSPEGYMHRCTYCGKPILEDELVLAVPEEGSEAISFCSQECADTYLSLHRESEEEDIFRAGAT